jgi:PAS domain-containing protein
LDENGEIKEIQSSGQDVSNLVATKDTLNLLFQALEQTSAAVIITDKDGLIIYANKKFKNRNS